MNLSNKKEIRKFIVEKRDAVDPNLRREWDSSIFNRLINSEYYKNAKVIFAFVSFKSEVDTHEIIKHALKNNKIICVPKIKSKETGIQIYKIRSMDDLKIGYFGILEPLDSCPEIDSREIDLILMPGAAFDRKGGRVGYGMGYYDRFLAKMNRKVDKIALAYSFQVLEDVPMDENDVSIEGIITEEEFMVHQNN